MADAQSELERAEWLLAARDLVAAAAAFERAERLGANVDRCAWGRWMSGMYVGDFEAAWRESDAIRRRGGDDPDRFWQGEELRGKRVIVRSLHGLGDAVQMLCYASRLRTECARLIVEVTPRLAELARGLVGVDEVMTWDDPAPEWDVQVEVMELPHLFRTQLAELPIAERYLTLPQAAREKARAAMGRRERPRVGIVWAAGEWDPARSLPFSWVEMLAGEAGCEFWSLQGGVDQGVWRGLPAGLGARDAAECGEGLMALAAVVAEMDLVITVDTFAAHLAGALGTPGWVLLQHTGDWRWMLEREDSPWYPSLRLIRQPSPGDWGSVIRMAQTRLAEWVQKQDGGGV